MNSLLINFIKSTQNIYILREANFFDYKDKLYYFTIIFSS